MGIAGLLLAIAFGAALLALWCYVRWPGAAPGSLTGAVLRALLGFALLHVGAVGLESAAGASTGFAVLAVVGVVVPILTFAFLTSLWIMKVFADALKGFV
jgi:hypothetical protein